MIKAQRYACTHARICVYTRTQKNMWNKCKNHSLNECGCRDAPCKKSWKQGNPLSNTIKDTSTIMRNPSLHDSGKGLRMIVLVSLIVLLRGFPCFHDFLHGASYIHIHSMNDFCTCIFMDRCKQCGKRSSILPVACGLP